MISRNSSSRLPSSSGAIELYIGLPYLPPDHGPWRFRFDDIVMGLPP